MEPETKPKTSGALHSAKTGEHGTPERVAELGRIVLGAIDLDPASSAKFNKTIQAAKYYTAKDDGLKQKWEGRTFLNPPGQCPLKQLPRRAHMPARWKRTGCNRISTTEKPPTCTCKLVPRFWGRLVSAWSAREVPSAIYVGYSLEQLQTLQSARRHFHYALTPNSFPTCFPEKRLPFSGPSPTHANFITLLPGHARHERLFCEVFAELGEVRL